MDPRAADRSRTQMAPTRDVALPPGQGTPPGGQGSVNGSPLMSLSHLPKGMTLQEWLRLLTAHLAPATHQEDSGQRDAHHAALQAALGSHG